MGKVSYNEVVMRELISSALDKLDPAKDVESQAEAFLADIGMTTTERLVTQAFIVACKVKKINYGSVIVGVRKQYPKVSDNIIESVLKKAFKDWAEKNPVLAEKCYKPSLINLLKVFAGEFM